MGGERGITYVMLNPGKVVEIAKDTGQPIKPP